MTSNVTIKQKKEYAKLLFLRENLTQAEIAEKVEVSRVTVNKWAKAEHWEKLRISLSMTSEQQLSAWYDQLSAINKKISLRNEEERFATSAEADIINKISSSIKKLEGDAGIGDCVSVGMRFISYLREIDPEKTKEYNEFWNSFIKSLLV